MQKGSLRYFLQGVGVAVVALLLALSLGAAASRPLGLRPLLLALTGDDEAAPKKLAGSQAGPASEAPAAGPQEKIKVHGDWTIEVRNPDGTLVTRREIKNSLVPFGGEYVFQQVLTHLKSVGGWNIRVAGLSCAPNKGCTLVSPFNPNATSGSEVFYPLAVDIPTSGPNAGKLELDGAIVAAADGQLAGLTSVAALCDPTFRPSSPCTTATTLPFYGPQNMQFTTVATSVNVLAGQVVTITVVFTFS